VTQKERIYPAPSWAVLLEAKLTCTREETGNTRQRWSLKIQEDLTDLIVECTEDKYGFL
jgi:hypothetical protein